MASLYLVARNCAGLTFSLDTSRCDLTKKKAHSLTDQNRLVVLSRLEGLGLTKSGDELLAFRILEIANAEEMLERAQLYPNAITAFEQTIDRFDLR